MQNKKFEELTFFIRAQCNPSEDWLSVVNLSGIKGGGVAVRHS